MPTWAFFSLSFSFSNPKKNSTFIPLPDENLCSHMMALGNSIFFHGFLRNLNEITEFMNCGALRNYSNTCCSFTMRFRRKREKARRKVFSGVDFDFLRQVLIFTVRGIHGRGFGRFLWTMIKFTNCDSKTDQNFFFYSSLRVMFNKEYFAESINSDIGFYGFHCESYFQYVFGWCNLKQKVGSKLGLNRVKMGEHCERKYVKLTFFFLDIELFDSMSWMDALKAFLLIFFSLFSPQSWRYCLRKYTPKGAICDGIIEFWNAKQFKYLISLVNRWCTSQVKNVTLNFIAIALKHKIIKQNIYVQVYRYGLIIYLWLTRFKLNKFAGLKQNKSKWNLQEHYSEIYQFGFSHNSHEHETNKLP